MTAPRHHMVKTVVDVFHDVWDHRKPFEVRKDDRGYAVGDLVFQHEYDPAAATFSGRYVLGRITYKLDGGQFGIEPGFCVLALDLLGNFTDAPLSDGQRSRRPLEVAIYREAKTGDEAAEFLADPLGFLARET